MKRVVIATAVLSVVTAGGGLVALAESSSTPSGWTGMRAGVAVVDASWHVGAGAGQYASDNNPSNIQNEWDPNVQHVKQASSYGVQSRLQIRAIVAQDGMGHAPVALVKVDNYLAQDMLQRRIAQILSADGNPVTYDHLLVSATHDHNSPYYSSPAAGVWVFQDAVDLRMFEYQARQAASAIEQATAHMVPAQVGATTVNFPWMQGNIAGAEVNEDGSPTGYPLQDNDHGVVVMRFDDLTDRDHPKPLATWVNYAEHGESLDGYDMFSADWLAPFQRYVDRMTGVPVVFSQGSVGSAEGPYDHSYANRGGGAPILTDGGDAVNAVWAHMGYAQAERGAHLLAEQVVTAWNAIGRGDRSVQSPSASNVPVLMLTHFVAGPVSHPYPSVGNCRTGPTDAGDPGVPAAGLPDCARTSDPPDPFPGFTLPFSPNLLKTLKANGIPVPDNYDATSFGTVEENARIKLQAVRLGDILLASCSCEAQADLIRNLETRTDGSVGDQWFGFDYANQAHVDEAWPVGYDQGQPATQVQACYSLSATSYSCPDPRDYLGQRRLTVTKPAYDHMEAEINNDAAGWNDPTYAAQANSEPNDVTQIKGNFTHTELGAGAFAACRGYAVSVGLGHTGDYDGYTVSYREYMARDAYRKALTTYGPHTADYMNTNLLSMAANLRCGSPILAQPTDPIATADEERQLAESTALGQISSAYYDAWTAQIPDSAGPAAPFTQPAAEVQRFDDATFTWTGGDNWTDNPTAQVERQAADGSWQPYADQSGEVVVSLTPPSSDFVSNTPTYRTGKQAWRWTASFEVFDASPRVDQVGGQVANGVYRFVVDGAIHTGGSVSPYHFASTPFTVVPWTGITAHDLTVSGHTASFVVDPIRYPRLPAHHSQLKFYADDQGGLVNAAGNYVYSVVCKRCAVRPWATVGTVTSAVVLITSVDGHQRRVPAAYDASSGRWVATVDQRPGDVITVPAGGIRDGYGETNGQPLTATP
ncbi:MAG: hypothetical protein QOG34_349 [Frankiaceae bacterium]|nr:hypothetical protein [Frankiaceae bacterium]